MTAMRAVLVITVIVALAAAPILDLNLIGSAGNPAAYAAPADNPSLQNGNGNDNCPENGNGNDNVLD
ncbi:MAG: hypothetical protein M3O34_19750, partial [Chloroflexota bacterium]|nr:hypothetical protein [Chloroflexota bacterium]